MPLERNIFVVLANKYYLMGLIDIFKLFSTVVPTAVLLTNLSNVEIIC